LALTLAKAWRTFFSAAVLSLDFIRIKLY
jgi:hypothetical protein